DTRPAHARGQVGGCPAPWPALAASPSLPPRDASHGPHTRARGSVIHADRWVVLLRVVVGVWFVKAVWTKFTLAYLWDVIPYPSVSPRFLAFHPKRIAEFAAGNTLDGYREFLEGTVLPS